jgi:hypothetical protein
MNALTQRPLGAVSTVFAQTPAAQFGADDLSQGVSSGFAVFSYKGKQWAVNHRGERTNLTNDRGEPLFSVELVLLKASPSISKVFYVNGYVEGSDAPPDCFSLRGIIPDPTSPKIQSTACATCPQNQWGSKITPAGKKGKACADSRRLAVVPLHDIENEVYGGPMLLRVPAASLNDLASFGKKMQSLGYPYNAIGVRVSFDMNEAYPKLVFNAIRVLTDEEAAKVVEHLQGDGVERVLREMEGETVDAAPPASVAGAFEQAPTTAAPAALAAAGAAMGAAAATQAAPVTQEVTQPAPAPTPAPKAEKKAAPKPEPEPQVAIDQETGEVVEVVEVSEEEGATGAASFDDMLDQLMG